MLITDGLLAHGEEFSSEETNGGVDTGAALYEKLRAGDPKLPIVVYTTERKTFQDLNRLHDAYLIAVSEFGDHPTRLILAAAERLLLGAGT